MYINIVLFQHPFISGATDSKPICDLLAEFKAEIVEEEIMDVNEDKEVKIRFLSLTSCVSRSFGSSLQKFTYYSKVI